MDFAEILGTGEAPPVQAMSPQGPEASPEATGSSFGGGFMDKMRTDPAFSQAMLMMGARLMQGPKNGQDFAGLVGDAALIGATAHGFVRANEQSHALKQKEFALKEQEAGVRMDSTKAQTAQVQQETSQKATLFPEVQAKVAQEVKNLRASGRKTEADALLQEAKANNFSAEWELARRKGEADIVQSNAAAGASNASALAQQANARLIGVKADAATNLQFEGQDEAVLHGSGKKGAAGAKQKMDEMFTYLRASDPQKKTYTDEQLYEKVARMHDPSKMKGEDIQTLRLLAENGSRDQQKFALDQLFQMAGGTAGAATGPAPAKPTPTKAPKRGEKLTVVRTGRDANGRVVQQLSDGSIKYVD